MNEAYCMDCMEYMKTVPDNYFDLAVVDPPYGGAGNEFAGKTRFGQRFDKYKPEIKMDRRGCGHNKYNKAIIEWDNAPDGEYFEELFRISKNQIIWGGNYFDLPPTRCFLIWEKTSIPEQFTMAMCEYAWTSFNDNAKIFKWSSQGRSDDPRFHPTQKPIALYDWIFDKYTENGFKIFDSHLGSGSSRISAWRHGLDFVGTEISKDYFEKQEERFKRETAQVTWQQFDKDFFG